MISFSCPHCGMSYQVKEEFAGRTTQCKGCKHALQVPAPAAVPETIAAPQVVGAAASLAQAGLGGGVTLSMHAVAGDPTLEPCGVKEVLARQGKSGERYVVEGEIARGGMGVVLRAVDCDIRREVALKFLLDPSNPNKTLRFIEEAQITGQLEHPNIVPVHELGIDGQKRVFFSMKMIKGRSLAQILDDLRSGAPNAAATYSLGRLLNVLVATCHALAYAHSMSVVHRDLKPANIMVGDFGEVYVMDWGLAKILAPEARIVTPAEQFAASMGQELPEGPSVASKVMTSRDSETELTVDGTVLGTPVYMPPEQASGRVREVGPHSDVYAIGAILYEMLTLEPPVARDGGFQQILKRVVRGEIVPPASRAPQRAEAGRIPPELAAVAMKALATEPGQRYACVELLRRDIELFQEGRSVSAKEDTRREMVYKFVKRNKGISATALAAAAVVLIVLVSSSWINFRAAQAARKAYEERVAAEQEKLERTRKAVPALLESAQLSLERHQFDNALGQVRLALEYEPEYPDALLMHGQILMAFQRDFRAARKEFERYLRHRPDRGDVRDLCDYCMRGDAMEENTLLFIAEILTRQQVPSLADQILRDIGPDSATAREFLLKGYRERVDAAWPGLGKYLTQQPAGRLLARFSSSPQVTALTKIQGLPITDLDLRGCRDLRDLGPLKGMPLLTLDVSSTQVSDLAPLAGGRLTSLDIGGTPVTDLSPLERLPLQTLNINGTKIASLKPLRGMPLQSLNAIGCSGISDVSPLEKAPLERLNLASTSVSDLEPLRGMPLKELSLFGCFKVSNLAPLKGMKLTSLDLTSTEVVDLEPLRGMPIATLNLENCPRVRDLGPLKGMPLTSLGLANCKGVQSLAPIEGMKLTKVTLQGCQSIRDLSPLKGMRLVSLSLESCPVEDLSPLAGMPLIDLNLKSCARITDLRPLKSLQLVSIRLPFQEVMGLEVLRAMESLTTINGMPAADFWREREKKKP